MLTLFLELGFNISDGFYITNSTTLVLYLDLDLSLPNQKVDFAFLLNEKQMQSLHHILQAQGQFSPLQAGTIFSWLGSDNMRVDNNLNARDLREVVIYGVLENEAKMSATIVM